MPLAGCSGEDKENREANTEEPTPEPTATQTPTTTEETTGKTTEETTEEEETPELKQIKIGEVFGEGDIQAVVRRFTKKQKLDEYTEAGIGNDYAIIRLVVKNVSNKYDTDLNSFNPLFSATLKDEEDYVYEEVFSMINTDTPFVNSTLVPGGVMRGDKVYKVPDKVSGLKLQFNFSNEEIIDLNKVNVDLTEEVDEIADLSQEFEVELHEVGDSASYEGLKLTINEVEFTEGNNEQDIIVDLTFENDTGGEVSENHLWELHCKDGRGRYLDKGLGTSLSQEYSTDNPLSPGENRRGKVVFESPRDVDSLYCSFDFSEHVEGNKEIWQLV